MKDIYVKHSKTLSSDITLRMKKCPAVFFFVLFFICFQSVNAQKAFEDSLRNLLKQNIADTLRVKYLLYFADRSDKNNREGAWSLLDSADAVAKKIHDKRWQLNVFASKGLLCQNLGKLDSSLLYFNRVLEYEGDTSMQFPVSRVWSNIINHYRQIGDLQTALKYAFKCVKYYNEQKKYKLLFMIYTNIAGIFFDLKDAHKSLEYDKKAIDIAIENKLNDKLPALYRNYASAYGDFGNTDSAMFYYKKSLQIAQELDDPEEVAGSLQSIGNEYLMAEQLDSAEYYFMKAKKINEEEDIYDESYPMLYCYLGQIEGKRKNYKQALIYLIKADSLAKTIGFISDQVDVKKTLAEVYAATGDWQKAFEYQQQYVLLNDSMQRDENIRITRELERKYDIAKREKENAELKAVNDLQQSKLKGRNYLLAGAGAGVALLVLLLFFIFRNYRNERKHVAILDKLNLQLTNQRDEILNINQLLQLKVLRTQMNPHFIYNCLNAINNLVMKGENDSASNYLLNFAKLLRMILDFSDKTYVDLEDEIKFIRLYLSLEAMRMGNDFSYEVKAPQHILDDDIAVPSLLVQPFIENAIWHGLINKDGEKRLTVFFEGLNGNHQLKCVVEDNGVGREKATERKKNSHTMLHESKGIRITQERIELLRYQIKNEVSISITDKKNNQNQPEGTVVELILPTQG